MPIDKLLPSEWLKKAEYAFFIGWGYSVISIIIAALVFPADPSLPAIAFTSIMILPGIKRLFRLREDMLKKEKNFSFSSLFRDNREFIKVYIFLSLGIFLVYSTTAIILPSFQVNKLFETQLASTGIYGYAVNFSITLFWSIFSNNFIVLLACFLVSLFTGDGGIFIITWNLSVWGTIFGVMARNSAMAIGSNPLMMFFMLISIVSVHGSLEMLAYIIGAISGGMIIKGLRKGGYRSEKYKTLLCYNMVLFIIAINILILSGLIEVFVLNNSGLYREIIAMSYG